jgi:hypothetical protein
MSDNIARLYEEDFVRWTEQQSRALREAAKLGTNLPLDWANLAEEIGDLGRSIRHELRSRISTIIEHLLKLEHSPASRPRRGRMDTIDRERSDIDRLLQENPNLKGDVARLIIEEAPRVARLTTRLLLRHRESTRALAPPSYTEDQALGDWFPGDAPLPASGEREEPA